MQTSFAIAFPASESKKALDQRHFAGCDSILSLFVVVALVSGCTTATYQPYRGEQQQWPTAPGAFVETVNGTSVYTGFPSKPYEVTGIVSVTITDGLGADSMLNSRLVSEAVKHGANAVVRVGSNTAYSGSYNMPGSSQTFGTATATSVGRHTYVRGKQRQFPSPAIAMR